MGTIVLNIINIVPSLNIVPTIPTLINNHVSSSINNIVPTQINDIMPTHINIVSTRQLSWHCAIVPTPINMSQFPSIFNFRNFHQHYRPNFMPLSQLSSKFSTSHQNFPTINNVPTLINDHVPTLINDHVLMSKLINNNILTLINDDVPTLINNVPSLINNVPTLINNDVPTLINICPNSHQQ